MIVKCLSFSRKISRIGGLGELILRSGMGKIKTTSFVGVKNEPSTTKQFPTTDTK